MKALGSMYPQVRWVHARVCVICDGRHGCSGAASCRRRTANGSILACFCTLPCRWCRAPWRPVTCTRHSRLCPADASGRSAERPVLQGELQPCWPYRGTQHTPSFTPPVLMWVYRGPSPATALGARTHARTHVHAHVPPPALGFGLLRCTHMHTNTCTKVHMP